MILIVSKYLIPKGYRGLTFFPFVVLKYESDREDAVLLNHEKIHLRQQLELLVLPFFVWYLLEYLIKLLKFRSSSQAYRHISFEREAYGNENNARYLKERRGYAFLQFL